MDVMRPILLGVCPFCGGGVTASIRRRDEGNAGMWYVLYQYADRPECANGCPIDRFNDYRLLLDGWGLGDDFDPAPSFRRMWARDVRGFRERTSCPRCGRPPRLRTGADPAVGCPRCGLWANDADRGGPTVIGLVEAWNRFAGKERNDGTR